MPAEVQLVAPTVHLNGTGRDDLLDALETAHEALTAAHDALRKTAPNGRDYYVQKIGNLEKAIDEHTDRMRRIMHVEAEIAAIICAIVDNEETATAEVR